MSTSTLSRSIDFEPLEDRLLFSATPVVAVDVPDEVKIGEDVNVTVTFENSDADEAGYGPYVDVFINSRGADADEAHGGVNPADQADGLHLNSLTPEYLGFDLNYFEFTLDDTANGGQGIAHPYAVDVNGDPIYVKSWDYYFEPNGTPKTLDGNGDPIIPANDPYYNLIATGQYRNGDTLLVIELPFGSFTPGQPQAEINFGLTLSEYADIGHTLNITAVGAFRFGNTPVNDYATDPTIIGIPDLATTTVDATLAELTKEYVGPENETATGPNYERAYRINIDIANGQTLTDLNIFDELPDYAQFVSYTTSANLTVDSATLPSTLTPGGEFHLTLTGDVAGTGAEVDAWVEIRFYVPRVDANGVEIIPGHSGAFQTFDNQAYGYANWTPVDPRDAPIRVGLEATVDPILANPADPQDFGDPEHEDLQAQSIAIQKGYTNITGAGDTSGIVRPEDVLEYTLEFQVSDYFAFGDIIITDTLSDGLDFYDPSIYEITLTLDGNTFNFTLGTNLSNFVTFSVNPNGTTTVIYNVSGALQYAADNGLFSFDPGSSTAQRDADLDYAQDGKLLGGGINPEFGDRIGEIANDLNGGLGAGIGYLGYNAGATIGTITYRAQVRDSFREIGSGWSDELAINPRDELNNSVIIQGDVLTLTTENLDESPTGQAVTDDFGVGLSIVEDEVAKEIYAVNGHIIGSPEFNDYLDSNGNVNLQPGDAVTYRITYTVPTGDVEKLRFTDFLPLPVFDIDDPDADGFADGYGTEWTFVQNLNPDGTVNFTVVPLTGGITYGPTHSLHTVDEDSALNAAPVLSFNSTANSITFTLGTAVSTANDPLVVDLLFTVTVNSQAFADGLYLTNQVQSGERSTQQPDQDNEATTNAIIQIVLNEPVVNIYKGVVASTQGGTQTEGGLAFEAAGTEGLGDNDGFTGTLVGADNAELIGALNLESGSLPDGGDLVRFAIVAQNTGRSDAFDVAITDTVQGSYVNNYADTATFVGETNFQVYRGDGTLLNFGADYTVVWDNILKTFTVELTDNYTSGNTSAADTKPGALSRGIDPSEPLVSQEIDNGSNSIVILYDLTVALAAQASSTVVNTATLNSYAGQEGKINHVIPGTITDTAFVVLDSPDFEKTLTDSIIETGNTLTDAVIGEFVEYTLVITLSEGTTFGATLSDTLASGLAFVAVDSVTFSAGVSSSNGDFVATMTADDSPDYLTVQNSGTTLIFDLGNLINANTNNGTTETITIVYRAVVLNTTDNQAGDSLGNSADFEYEWVNDGTLPLLPIGGNDTISSDSDPVTIVEPHLDVNKRVGNAFSATSSGYQTGSLSGFDAADTVYYSIVIRNDGTTNAYDISLSDLMPTGLGSLSIRPETTSTGTVWINGVISGITDAHLDWSGSTLIFDPAFNIDLAPSATITIHVSGVLLTSVQPGQTFHNDAVVKWTSLNGDFSAAQSIHNAASTERGGGGANPTNNTDSSATDSPANNYAHSDRASVVIDVPDNAKSIVATSESFTAGSSVAIGEIVRYQIIVRIPEGTSPDLQIVDQLPAGMVFINDGTATIRFDADSGANDLSAAGFGGAVGDNSLLSFTDGQISTAAGSNNDNYNNGTAVRFKLGDVINNNTDNAQSEYLVIEFNALVLNTTANQASTVLTNTATSRINGNTTVGNTATVDATVAEANLAVTKTTAELGPIDAGDTFSYTVTISNNASGGNSTPAFDVRVQDAIDAIVAGNPSVELNFLSYSLGALPGGTSILAGGDTSSYGVGGVLDVVFNRLDAGQSITITVNVEVKAGALAGAEIENKAVVFYTSLPGASGTTGVNNVAYGTTVETAITSVLASADANNGTVDLGAAASERGGSDVPNPTNNNAPANNAILNNYAVAASSAAGLTVATPTIDKQWQDGTLTADDTSLTSSTDGNVVIGERLTYDIVVTLPEGITDNLQIQDILPIGFRADSIQLINPNGVIFELDPITGFTPVSGTGAALNLNFGDATLGADGNASNNSFTIRVTGTVENIADNQRLDILTGAATLTYSDPDAAGNSSDTPATRTVNDANAANNPTFTIQEPTVTIGKTVDFAGPNLDAGDTLTYTIDLGNTSGQTAYEITLNDELSDLLTNFASLTADHSTLGDIADEFEIVDAGGGNWVLRTISGADIDLANGQTISITFTANIVANIGASVDIENTAAVRWTSTDGALDHLDERTGDEVPFATAPTNAVFDQDSSALPVDNYAVSSSVVTEVTSAIVAAKTLVTNPSDINDNGSVTPGEIVTYQIVVTLPEGVAANFQIQDLIPPGMQYLAGSFLLTDQDTGVTFTTTPSLGTATAVGGGSFGDGTDVLFTFGEITVAATSGTNENTFTFTYQAVALDSVNLDGITTAGDGDGQTPHNNAASHNNGSGTSYTYDAGIVPLTAVEPRLTVAKDVDDSTPDIGDTVTFTLTIANLAANGSTTTAYDIRVRDLLSSGLTDLDVSSITVNGATVVSNSSTTSALDLVLASIALGDSVTITFDAVVENTLANVGDVITNTVNLHYDNLPDDEGTFPETGNTTNGETDGTSGDRDYTTTDNAVLTVNAASISGYVYHDADNDGIRDLGEAALASVTMTLTGTTDTLLPVSITVTTDGNGYYLFDGLPQGDYVITQTQPTGYLDGKETVGTLFGGTVDNTLVNQTIIDITIPDQSTGDAENYNFGELLAATISGTVYQDFDNDGVIDVSETGLAGVQVELTGTNDFGAITTIIVTTDADGNYAFTDLRPGTYTVTEIQPLGYLDGKETAGSTGGAVINTTDNNTITGIVVNGAGGAPSNSTSNNFGELDPASISGYVYLDLNDDGVKDAFESGLANVSIELEGTDDRNNPVNLTLTTDANGFYNFTNLRPGQYVVSETTQPTGYLDGQDSLGSGFAPSVGSHDGTVSPDAFEAISILNVAPGNNAGVNYNFGELFNAAPVKSIIATSEDHTTGTVDLAIGEIVRYRLTFDVPYGTVYDVAALDNFIQTSGLQYIAGSESITLGTGLSSNLVPSAASSRAGDTAFASGTDIWFLLGNLTNANADGSPSQVTIEFDALVVNETANQNGRDLENEFQLYWDQTGNLASTDAADLVDTSNTVLNTVVEPALSFTQVISADSDFDAGDTVIITLTISNTGASAFDLALTDLLDGKFDLTQIVFDDNGTGAIWSYTGDLGTDTVSGTIDRLDQNETVTITLTATLRDTVNPSEVLEADASLTWSSLPGTGTAVGAPGNDTESSTPGTSGEADGERNGTDGVGGALNDYALVASDSLTITEELLIDKSRIAGSATPQIGDVLTFQLAITVIEGITENLVIVDQLPVSGLENQLVYLNNAVISDANGLTLATLNASYNAATNQLTLTLDSAAYSGLDDTDTLATGTFYITYDALVANVASNIGALSNPTVLTNSVTATATGTTPPPADSVTVTVTEPALQIAKSVNDITPDLGQTLDYELVITHTSESSATAYDIIVRDLAPTGLTIDLATVEINGVPLASSPLVNLGSDSSTSAGLLFTLNELASGGTITITYQATVSEDHGYLGDSLDNNARIYWDTQAGEDTNPVFTGDATGDDLDRDYGATGGDEVHNLDSQDEQDTQQITINNNSIAGTVYRDVNNDGDFDLGTDTGIEGVTLTLEGLDLNGNPVSLEVITDADGNYLFEFVPPSGTNDYVITQTQPVDYLDAFETVGTLFGGTVDNVQDSNVISTLVIPVQSNAAATGYNFGEVIGSTISGSVYEDWNNNGIRNLGEAGIEGIEITLTGTDVYGATVTLTTLTDADGNYSFEDLRPSDLTGYTLTEGTVPTPSPTGGYNDGRDTDGSLGNGDATTLNDVISSIVIGQDTDATNYWFGELNPASLSGYVYNDANGNGTKDPGELGIFNTVVELEGTDDLGNAVNVTTSTDSTGFYEFLYLRPGTYTITETQPSGFADGDDTLGEGLATDPANGNDNGTLGNDLVTNIVIVNVNPANADGINYNFGEVLDLELAKTIVSTTETATPEGSADTTADPRLVSIGEVVRYRLVMEIPEGTQGTVVLRDLLPDGLTFLNDGTITLSFINASGSGAITSSTLGTWVAANGTVTPSSLLGDSAISSDLANTEDNYVAGGDVYFHLGTLTSQQNDFDKEFVVIEFNTLVTDHSSNFAGEQKVNTFEVLYDSDNDILTPPETAIGLPPVDAPVLEIVEPKLTVSKSSDDANGFVYAGQFVTYTITLSHAPDSTATAFDVALRDLIPTGTSYVEGSLQWVSGVMGTLSDTGGIIVASYDALEFGEATTLSFQVQVATNAKAGTNIDNNVRISYDSLVGDDNNPNDPNSPVTPDTEDRDYGATPGTEVFDQDTDPHQDTERITLGSAVISDFVWFDVNGDKFQNGEKGIAGVKLNLYSNVNDVLTLIGTQTTDSNGLYAFKNLADGDFVVRVVAATLPDSGATVATYDYDGLGTKHTASVTLTEVNEINRKVDFGYRGTGVIGDKVFVDANNNGIFDGEDTGISGVKITLTWTNPKGGVITLTTTTDAGGNYKFENLFGGDYRLAVNATQIEENLDPVYDLDGVFSPHVAGLTLGAGNTRMDGDFGYFDPSSMFANVISQPGGLFGISFNTLSVYYQTTYDPTFDEWALPAWELIDSTPIFSSPLLSGHAEPGSKLVLALYNHQGELLSTSTVLVSSGGNWTVGFAGVKVNGPITIVSSVSSGDFTALTTDNNFNFRTNYITGLAGGYFQSRAMNVESAFSSLAYERVAAMVAEDEKELTIGWIKNDYEFLAEPGLPGGNE